MIKEKNIDFKGFYIREFLDLAHSKIGENLSGENTDLLKALISNLSMEEDISAGIEKLAREKGSGELSIFLFDIIDRIGDYPPSVAYDALNDIVEDFVNATSIMLEEPETVEAVNKVNQIYKESPEVLAEEIKEPKEPPAETEKPAEEPIEPVEEGVDFIDFFTEYLWEILEKEFPARRRDELFVFTRILSQDNSESLPPEFKVLKKLFDRLHPQVDEKKFSVKNFMEHFESALRQYILQLKEFSVEHPEMIKDSLGADRLVVPAKEPEKAKEYKPEEIPEQPTTIDSILSEYFITEIDDHRARVEQVFTQLQGAPDDRQLMKKLIGEFNSLKEISMIHGYPVIESFCTNLLQELQSGHQKKRKFNYETIPLFMDILDNLKSLDQLRNPKKQTPVSKKLDGLLVDLKKKIWSKPAVRPAPEPEEIEKQPVYSFKDKEKLLEIFSEVVKSYSPAIEKAAKRPDSIGDVLIRMTSLENTALMLGQNNIAKVFAIFSNEFRTVQEGDSTSGHTEFFCEKLGEFFRDFPENTDTTYWQEQFSQKKDEENFSIEQSDKLLDIICEIEHKNLNSFDQTLEKVFSVRDQSERSSQHRHFKRLHENLLLLGAKKSTGFAEFFSSLFRSENGVEINQDVQNELKESYKIFLESLDKNGVETDISDLMQVLDEILKTPVIEDKPEERSRPSGPAEEEPAEHEEEDLHEIFRQEANNYLENADSALQRISADPTDQEALNEIERNVHSLKASARLMGYGDVADLASPLESICEKIVGHKIGNMEEVAALMGEGFHLLKDHVNGRKISPEKFLERISGLDIKVTEKIEGPDQKKINIDEKPLFSTSQEEDEDLLQIFKEESSEFIRIIEEANEKLKTKPGEKESLTQLENASHSLKSAAKMLGFREIGQIGDAIEGVAEAIKQNDIRATDTVTQRISDSLHTIQNLTGGQKLDMQNFAALMKSMDVKTITEEQTSSGEGSDTSFFVDEGTDLIERINIDLLALEKTPVNQDLVDNLSRNLHTLKGSSQIVGLDNIGSLAHSMEDYFDLIKSEKRSIEQDEMDVLFKGVDEIQTLIALVKKGDRDESASFKSVMGLLERKLYKKHGTQADKEDMRQIPPDADSSHVAGSEQVIKVTTERLDNLINMAAELVVNKSQLTNYLEKLKDISSKIDTDKRKLKSSTEAINSFMEKLQREETAPAGKDEFLKLSEVSGDFKHAVETFDSVVRDFKNITQNFELNLGQISSLTKLLHDDILQVRMVPTTVLFSRFPRAVRDLANKQKKKINLIVEGENTEIDRAMVESLTDPVMHLVRNAVDHGIETPAQRLKKKKSEEGILLLRAGRDKSHIIVEVEDDGNGIDPEDLKKAIVRKKMAKKADADKMKPEELIQYIFKPGFSTKKGASKLSGRGVGLDVVGENIRKIKGDISINSTPGKGTIFSIRVPLTLAITQAMLIESQGEQLAVPLSDVEETVEVNEKDIVTKDGRNYIALRDEEIPLVEIKRYLKYESAAEPAPVQMNYALIIKEKEIKYALLVDKVRRREEIVVKSLGEELNNLEFISGGTILGDGKVALILDVDGISRSVNREYFGKAPDFASLELARNVVHKQEPEVAKPSPKSAKIKKRKIKDRPPVALIVDDSLSVRKFVSSVLERNKYETKLANDGNEAVAQLEGNDFDVIITDLEMPEMSGFDLIEKIRKEPKFDQIPIIILTGRAGKESKEKGIEFGANAYIVKPFKENDLLKILDEYIEVDS